MRHAWRVLIAVVWLGFCPFALAQSYPDKTVKIVVPYPAGGPYDVMARAVAQRLSPMWNVPVIVENKVGANAIIATESVARSEPDGYTILLSDATSMSLNPALQNKLPYDPVKDFTPVIKMYQSACVFVAAPTLEAKNLQEFVALAKSKPSVINYGSFGLGSFSHLHQEELDHLLGISLFHVPYKGMAGVIQALIGGQVQVALAGYAAVGSLIKDGRLKAIAIGRDRRLTEHPEIPTFKELGVPFTCYTWVGLAVPAKTPKALVDKIAHDVGGVISTPDFQ